MRHILLWIFLLWVNIVFAAYSTPGSGSTQYEYITNVSIANVNNTTTGTDADGNSDATYDYFSSEPIHLNRSKSYQLSVSIEAYGQNYVTAWFDWNGDETFDTSTEQYVLVANTSSNGPHTTSISVPAGASLGSTRLRVRVTYQSIPDPENTQTYGEIEDYEIYISKYVYLGDWSSTGLPNYLTTSDNVPSATMTLINDVLPEGTPNLEYIDYNDYLNVSVDTGTRIWASFIHEGAGWKNTFGMYQYPTTTPPSSTNDIDSITIIFPNVSASGSGGSLLAGHKVYYDSVDAGTTVAFALVAQGWDNAHTTSAINNTGVYTHYSNNNLNVEADNNLKPHNVTFWDPDQEKYILGFEDIRRDNSGCDQDFNDVLFYITLDPIPIFDEGGSEQQPPDITDPDNGNLPVEWLQVEAREENGNVKIQWYIASQLNNDYFVIERSTNLIDFETIGTIDGHGTTSQLIRYTFTDEDPNQGETYYRIKQVDYNGEFDYSNIVSINLDSSKDAFVSLYPNPVNQGQLNIRSEGLSGNIEVLIRDYQGRIVSSESFYVQSNFSKAVNTESLEAGIYILELSDGNKRIQRKFTVI
jgi:hypothetical protein